MILGMRCFRRFPRRQAEAGNVRQLTAPEWQPTPVWKAVRLKLPDRLKATMYWIPANARSLRQSRQQRTFTACRSRRGRCFAELQARFPELRRDKSAGTMRRSKRSDQRRRERRAKRSDVHGEIEPGELRSDEQGGGTAAMAAGTEPA